MGLWANQVVPRVLNASRGAALADLRRRACAGLHGDVVEIGFGSGQNLSFYPPEVRRVCAVEPSPVAWRLAGRHLRSTTAPVELAGTDAQELSAPDARFDCALSTLSLCTIPDPDAALAEIARVLRPGGTLHFLEHGLAPDARTATWQRRLEPWSRRLTGGCRLTRPIADHLEQSPLEVVQLEAFFAGPATPFSYAYLGRARRPN